MRLSRTAWLTLGIGILVIGAVVLYVLYDGQMEKQQQAKETIAAAEAVLPQLSSARGDREAVLAQVQLELTQLEADMGQKQATFDELVNELSLLEGDLSNLEDDRAQAILQAIMLLDATAAKFITSVESIEYNELLFEIADNTNLVIESISVAGPSSEVDGGVTYNTTTFNINMVGNVEDILAFINAVVKNDSFETAVIEPVKMTITEPLTDEQKEALKEAIRMELAGKAIDARMASLDTEDIIGFIFEAIDEVVGDDEFINLLVDGNDGQLDALSIDEMAATIMERIANSIYLEQKYEGPLADELAELIAEYIADTIVSKVTGPLAEGITELIFSGGEEGLVELLGEDMAALLGDEIEGVGNIAGIINGYIAQLIGEKMVGSAGDSVDEGLVEEIAAQSIIESEISSVTMTISIYAFESYTLESEE